MPSGDLASSGRGQALEASNENNTNKIQVEIDIILKKFFVTFCAT